MKKIVCLITVITIMLSSVIIGVNAVNQPSRYNLPVTFDDEYNPFSAIDNIYDNAAHRTDDGIEVIESGALNGSRSLKIGPVREGNQRTETVFAQMQPIANFSTSDFSKVSGIMFRIKIADDTNGRDHKFAIAVLQNNSSKKKMWLGNSAVVYDKDGEKISVRSEEHACYLPASFDGFVFLPLESARSENVSEPGYYDTYAKYPKKMVDLSKNHSIQLYFGDSSWNGTTVYCDDFATYSGKTAAEHYDTLKKMGYDITAVAQPEIYSLPLSFDNKYNPFISVNDVYDDAVHTGVIRPLLVSDAEALNGNLSLKIGPINAINQRTESNIAKMTAVSSFSKSDFTKVTGIMLRLKISDDIGDITHMLAVALRQNGVEKTTWLGNGAMVYDLAGNRVNTANVPLACNIPAGFDGFVFLPFASAQSEKVTVPGEYDMYDSFPDSMVDLANDYSLQVYFSDSSWNNTIVYLDDISIYSGTTHEKHLTFLKSLGYKISAVAQPDRYSLPLTFDNGLMPFNAVNDVYDDAVHWKKEGIFLVGGGETLNGSASVKVGPIKDGNQRTELNIVKMKAIPDFKKNDLAKATGILLRLKITGDGQKTHNFSIALRQDGVEKTTWLGRGAVAYDVTGKKINLTDISLACNLPGGFDGFVFLPFETAESEKVSVPGEYDTYGKFPESMVDLSKDYTMQIYFADDSYSGAVAFIDDMSVYSGSLHKDHLSALKSLGYNVTAVVQPERYSFPLKFDDGIMPFNAVDDVYDDTVHWKESGVELTSDAEALCGSKSVKIGPVRAGNQRTELNVVKMAPISGFSKKDFSSVTGVMLRVKIENGNSNSNYLLSFCLDQTGMKNRTWLGYGTSAYDLKGNPVELLDNDLNLSLPGDFDGYLFVPFATARSEVVTVAGHYDTYDTYPDSLVDLSKEYTMQVMLLSNWDNVTLYMDDMQIYKGDEHVNILKRLYSGIETVQQPKTYSLPFDFANGMTPFNPPVDGGLFVQNKNEHGTAGTVSYQKSDIRNRKVMRLDFAKDLIGAYNMYTTKASVRGNSNGKGLVLRVRTNAKESAGFTINTDWLTDDHIFFGSEAVLYDLKGEIVDSPREKQHWLAVSLPENFDGFVFIPYERGFIEKQNKYCIDVDGWKFSNKERLLMFTFYGEKQWQGSTLEIDYFGEYADTNYAGTIQSLGYSIDVTSELIYREIVGSARNKFFYNIRLNDSFENLKNWTVLTGKSQSDLNNYSDNCVELGNNVVNLLCKRNAGAYSTGAIRSVPKYSYGYYEATLSLPQNKGLESVFRIVTEGDYTAGGNAFEVDIAFLNEQYKLKTGYRYMEDHRPKANGGKVVDGEKEADINDTFANVSHTYGLLYTYNYLRFYVDGELVRIVENTFARSGVYIELAQNVIGDISEMSDKATKMSVSNVSYWEIDMDEMNTYDELSSDEKKFIADKADAANSGSDKKNDSRTTTSKVPFAIAILLGAIDVTLMIGTVSFIFVFKKKRG